MESTLLRLMGRVPSQDSDREPPRDWDEFFEARGGCADLFGSERDRQWEARRCLLTQRLTCSLTVACALEATRRRRQRLQQEPGGGQKQRVCRGCRERGRFSADPVSVSLLTISASHRIRDTCQKLIGPEFPGCANLNAYGGAWAPGPTRLVPN